MEEKFAKRTWRRRIREEDHRDSSGRENSMERKLE